MVLVVRRKAPVQGRTCEFGLKALWLCAVHVCVRCGDLPLRGEVALALQHFQELHPVISESGRGLRGSLSISFCGRHPFALGLSEDSRGPLHRGGRDRARAELLALDLFVATKLKRAGRNFEIHYV
eukprot:1145647-Pelagomonas_calceolata.AAC.1